jgi:hypothetical protein
MLRILRKILVKYLLKLVKRLKHIELAIVYQRK